MRPSPEELHGAVEAFAREAVPHHGRLQLTEPPIAILERGGCVSAAALWIVAILSKQGVLVPCAVNGSGASVEVRPGAFTAVQGGAIAPSDSTRRIAVLIDYPNIAKTLRSRGEVLSITRIRDALQDVGEIRTLRVFLDAARVPVEVRQDFHEMGVSIEDCPRTRDGETVDKLLTERATELLESDAVDTFAVTANDNDYARDVIRRVGDRQRTPILLVADPAGSAALREAAGGQWRTIGGSAFMPMVSEFLNAAAVANTVQSIATLAETFSLASDAVIEIIRYAAAIETEARNRRKGKLAYFAPKFLRDRIRSDTTTDLPHVATLEEQTACVLRLCEIGAFMPFLQEATDDIVRGQYVVDRAHPLVVFALDGTATAGVTVSVDAAQGDAR